MHRAPGAPRSEIKEEPKAGDIRGGEYPVACARALNSSALNSSALNSSAKNNNAKTQEGKNMALQHIPPIQCLLTFEAVARLRNASRAADELCVTPSAVSHRIRQLESHLGFKLFGRSDFSLTADGAAYLANVRTGLAALQAMPGGNAAKQQRATRLRIAVTPTFSRVFLMPRLELFRNIYPDIELVLQVSIPLLDVTAEQADLEVRFGTGAYADCEHRLLLDEEIGRASCRERVL